jgi:hypothetical protein
MSIIHFGKNDVFTFSSPSGKYLEYNGTTNYDNGAPFPTGQFTASEPQKSGQFSVMNPGNNDAYTWVSEQTNLTLMTTFFCNKGRPTIAPASELGISARTSDKMSLVVRELKDKQGGKNRIPVAITFRVTNNDTAWQIYRAKSIECVKGDEWFNFQAFGNGFSNDNLDSLFYLEYIKGGPNDQQDDSADSNETDDSGDTNDDHADDSADPTDQAGDKKKRNKRQLIIIISIVGGLIATFGLVYLYMRSRRKPNNNSQGNGSFPGYGFTGYVPGYGPGYAPGYGPTPP